MGDEQVADRDVQVERVLAVDVAASALDVDGPDPADVLVGQPVVSSRALGTLGDTEVGIWQITEGTVRDVEVDEVFVVLSGDATVRFEDGSSLELGPGAAVRLRAGERTEWEIRETLRKIYVV